MNKNTSKAMFEKEYWDDIMSHPVFKRKLNT